MRRSEKWFVLIKTKKTSLSTSWKVAEKGDERRRLWKGRDERTAGLKGVNQPFLEKLTTKKLLASSARTPVESHSLSAEDDQTLGQASYDGKLPLCSFP